MIPAVLLFPLIASGVIGAAWRGYKKQQNHHQRHPGPGLPAPESDEKIRPEVPPPQTSSTEFDDVEELHHYQRVSWYSLAFAASGSWFFAPALWVSFPLIGYNTYHLVKTIRHSDNANQKSPMTIFEVLGVTGSLIAGRPVIASLLFLLSFGSRKLLLQAGNISNNIGPSGALNSKFTKVWILRDSVEIETTIANLQKDDVVVLHAGDTTMLEGDIISGTGVMQQFSLHKKMKLVPKQAGGKVFPFTRLESGCLHIRCTH